MEQKFTFSLSPDTADMVAKILVGSMMAYNDQAEPPKYFKDMLMATIEYFEQVLDPSVHSVTTYITLLNMLPAGMKRNPPEPIAEFIRANSDRFPHFSHL